MNANPGVKERIYIRRRGRMTRGQARALDELYEKFSRPVSETAIDIDDWFERQAPVLLEIGFGMGDALVAFAEAHPDWNCVGVEIYRPGLGGVMARCAERGLDNVRLLEGDARTALAASLTPGSLDRIHVFFPDPWPKARHHKRRLIEPGFARLAATRLAPGGRLLLATDWEDYANQMLSVLEAEPALRNLAPAGGFSARTPDRPLTRFEERGMRLGHGVWDLAFTTA